LVELTEQQLQAESGATADELRRLIHLGVIRPSSDGGFSWADTHRIRMVRSFMRAGVTLEHIARALSEGLVDFGPVGQFFLPPAPATGGNYADFSQQVSGLGAVYENLGLPVPAPDRIMRQDEEDLVAELVATWSAIGDQKALERAARLAGDGVRRIVEGWMGLWLELMPTEAEPEAQAEASRDLGLRVTALLPKLLVWLEQRHLEQTFNAVNAELFEVALADRGWVPPPPRDAPAVMFVDVSGFTRLTEEQGDDRAVEVGAVLHDVAARVGRRHRGRLIKLLGDGAMLRFAGSMSALDAAVELTAEGQSWPSRFPPLRAGLEAGAVIEQDGDLFGRTVNIAARLCAVADPGDVVVGAGVQAAASDWAGGAFEPIGPLNLRGFTTPQPAFRVRPVG
jgi:adenylate cyclase